MSQNPEDNRRNSMEGGPERASGSGSAGGYEPIPHDGHEDFTEPYPHAQSSPNGQHTEPLPQYGTDGSYGYASDQSGYGAAADGSGYQYANYGQAGQGPDYGQAPAYGQGSGNPYAPEGSARRGHRFGTGTLIGGMFLAALLGGGVAVGAGALLNDGGSSTAAAAGPETTIVNNKDSVNAVTAAAQKASPSVATISVTGGQQSGSGSGVVLDDQGHILTNTHVVTLDGTSSNSSIQVKLANGAVKDAKVVGTDPTSDLAVIKVDPSGLSLTPATMADSSSLNVGDIAVAIGAPLGLDGTVTDGIVSNLNRTISVASSAAPDDGGSSDSGQGGSSPFQFEFPDKNGGTQNSQSKKSIALNVLQTDAAINPGNSGGALVNSKGEVIGINVAIASAGGQSDSSSSTSGNIGVGFSIPINYAKRIGQEIIDNGSASHGLLGATVSSSPAGGSNSSDSAFTNGAVIKDVSSGSPAAKAGLKSGDVVTKLNGHAISDAESLTAAVREAAANQEVDVTYTRGGNSTDAKVTLGDAASASSK
ncbi:S1C family serine protease [Kocuria sp. HSID16901]|uniref:S1C family serine protease n=1 Tax=Kocuria sp. HSID16901 TaxID=2419505 RepID=UPI0009E521B8|nr:trypsin-like peptidase domain-containing protein [Kocuria sp. HSID16901]RUQ22329.1 PDZ domain-containing protein [Kocuria sp. HSID16901]